VEKVETIHRFILVCCAVMDNLYLMIDFVYAAAHQSLCIILSIYWVIEECNRCIF
jgi:hypothetical protein